jgi:bone morphogenetic protein 7
LHPLLYSDKDLVLVDSISVGPAGGWLVLNVTDPLTSWVAFPDSNLGLYLSVHLPDKPGECKQPVPKRNVPKATHS